jgi:hypothetical protein
MNLWLRRWRARVQKIKITTVLCLGYMRRIQRAKAAFIPTLGWLPLRSSSR